MKQYFFEPDFHYKTSRNIDILLLRKHVLKDYNQFKLISNNLSQLEEEYYHMMYFKLCTTVIKTNTSLVIYRKMPLNICQANLLSWDLESVTHLLMFINKLIKIPQEICCILLQLWISFYSLYLRTSHLS